MIKSLESNLDKTTKGFQNALIENSCMKDKVKYFENENSTLQSIGKDLTRQLCEANIKCQDLINKSSLQKSSLEQISKEKLELCSKLKKLEL